MATDPASHPAANPGSEPVPAGPGSERRPPGTRIDMDGMLNLRDLGGWPIEGGGNVRVGQVYRSDRLSDLTDGDLERFDRLGVGVVVDLRSDIEVTEDPSRIWSGVTSHLHLAIGGDVAQQKSFIERILDGEFDGISDQWVGEAYIEMLETFGAQFGAAARAATTSEPALFHCTAGKDRTGLMSMLLLSTVAVRPEDIVTDFALSNRYRSEVRMEQLRPTFAERGLDVEEYRSALSAPIVAMEMALEWVNRAHGSAPDYLLGPGGLGADDVAAIEHILAG